MACFVSPNAGSGGGIDLNKEYTPINGGLVNYANTRQINVKKGDIILYSTYATMDSDFEPIIEHVENGNSNFIYPKHPSLSQLVPCFVAFIGTYQGQGSHATGYYCTKNKQVTIGTGLGDTSFIQLRKSSNYLPIYTRAANASTTNNQYVNTSNGVEIVLFAIQASLTQWKGSNGNWTSASGSQSFRSYDPSCDRFFGNAGANSSIFQSFVLHSGDGLIFNTNYFFALKRYNIVTD